VSASPALFPKFEPSVTDYVTRCMPRRRLRLSVGGRSRRLHLASGRSLSFVVRSGHRRRRYFVRCLPANFPTWKAYRPGRPQAQWYVVAPCCDPTRTYVAIFDNHGVPVWWINTHRPPLDASLLPGGGVVWAQQHGMDIAPSVSSGTYEEHAFDGTLLRTFSLPDGTPTDRHEMQLLPNGDYVVVAYVPRDGVDLRPYGPPDATVLDAHVEEVSPQHEIVWSWSSGDHISLSETGRWYARRVIARPLPLPDGRMAYDIVHINAVEPYGPHRFLMSFRHLDAIYSIAKSTGHVLWKLGGTKTPRSLRIVGDRRPDFGGPHDVRVLRDGTVTLHDNGTGRGRPARALRFRIDAAAGRATLVEKVSDRAGSRSRCCGSARKLPGGDWVISWGGTHLIEERTAAGKRAFALRFPLHISYRVFPVLPGRLTYRVLRRGMNAMQRP
jgi:hypothetical protein